MLPFARQAATALLLKLGLLLLCLLAGITGGVISHSGFEARFFGHVSALLLLLPPQPFKQ